MAGALARTALQGALGTRGGARAPEVRDRDRPGSIASKAFAGLGDDLELPVRAQARRPERVDAQRGGPNVPPGPRPTFRSGTSDERESASRSSRLLGGALGGAGLGGRGRLNDGWEQAQRVDQVRARPEPSRRPGDELELTLPARGRDRPQRDWSDGLELTLPDRSERARRLDDGWAQATRVVDPRDARSRPPRVLDDPSPSPREPEERFEDRFGGGSEPEERWDAERYSQRDDDDDDDDAKPATNALEVAAEASVDLGEEPDLEPEQTPSPRRSPERLVRKSDDRDRDREKRDKPRDRDRDRKRDKDKKDKPKETRDKAIAKDRDRDRDRRDRERDREREKAKEKERLRQKEKERKEKERKEKERREREKERERQKAKKRKRARSSSASSSPKRKRRASSPRDKKRRSASPPAKRKRADSSDSSSSESRRPRRAPAPALAAPKVVPKHVVAAKKKSLLATQTRQLQAIMQKLQTPGLDPATENKLRLLLKKVRWQMQGKAEGRPEPEEVRDGIEDLRASLMDSDSDVDN